MGNAEYWITNKMTNASWDSAEVSLQGLSLPGNEESISIVVPAEVFPSPLISRDIIVTFRIEDGYVEGTPLVVASRIYGGRRGSGKEQLKKYKTKNELWFLGNKVMIVNNEVMFIVLPTNPKTFLVSSMLMTTCSPMAKLVKEKVIPRLVNFNGAEIKIVSTSGWKVHLYVDSNIDRANDILLKHIDEI